MEGIRTENFVDCRKNMFGGEVENILLTEKSIILHGPTFHYPREQLIVCKELNIPAKEIKGIEYVKKKKQTRNWFEKIFSGKEEWIRIYY